MCCTHKAEDLWEQARIPPPSRQEAPGNPTTDVCNWALNAKYSASLPSSFLLLVFQRSHYSSSKFSTFLWWNMQRENQAGVVMRGEAAVIHSEGICKSCLPSQISLSFIRVKLQSHYTNLHSLLKVLIDFCSFDMPAYSLYFFSKCYLLFWNSSSFLTASSLSCLILSHWKEIQHTFCEKS